MVNTTLKVSKETKDTLDGLKIHPRQSYDEVVDKLIKSNGDSKEDGGE